jgi:hypothetical protein
MFRKMLAGVVVLVLALGSVCVVAAEQAMFRPFDLPIKVLYNARQIVSDVQPEAKNGVVFVPFRAVANALGAQLEVTPDWKTITFVRDERKVTITLGSKTAYVNGQKKELLVAPYATKGRTMVPTRFVSEQLGETVEWDSLSRYVWIGHKNVPTLEEAIEAVDLKPYEHYFTGRFAESKLTILDPGEDFGKKRTTVRIIKESDWPLVIAGDTITRMDRVVIDGKEYIRSVTTQKGLFGNSLYLLQTGEPLKVRSELSYMREYVGDWRAFYNLVVDLQDEILFGIKDYKKLKLKDVEYIGIHTHSDSVILMENYFK